MVRIDQYLGYSILQAVPSWDGGRVPYRRGWVANRESLNALPSLTEERGTDDYSTQIWSGTVETEDREIAWKFKRFVLLRDIRYEAFFMMPWTTDIVPHHDVLFSFSTGNPPFSPDFQEIKYPVGLDKSYVDKYWTNGNGYGKYICIFHEPSLKYLYGIVRGATTRDEDGVTYNVLAVYLLWNSELFSVGGLYSWRKEDITISFLLYGRLADFSVTFLPEFEINRFPVIFQEADNYPTLSVPVQYQAYDFVPEEDALWSIGAISDPGIGEIGELAPAYDSSALTDPGIGSVVTLASSYDTSEMGVVITPDISGVFLEFDILDEVGAPSIYVLPVNIIGFNFIDEEGGIVIGAIAGSSGTPVVVLPTLTVEDPVSAYDTSPIQDPGRGSVASLSFGFPDDPALPDPGIHLVDWLARAYDQSSLGDPGYGMVYPLAISYSADPTLPYPILGSVDWLVEQYGTSPLSDLGIGPVRYLALMSDLSGLILPPISVQFLAL